MKPLLKWAGGKRYMVEKILSLFPVHEESQYHEPFMGGGAVFFKLEPGKGSVNDVNPRLINFYRVVRDCPERLIEIASEYSYDKEEYYSRRKRFNSRPADAAEDASLLLYLNKTCYNGLYRVNSKGAFNVPFGTYKDPTIVHPDRITRASKLLQNVDIRNGDFGYILGEADEGDICYLDPPYMPASRTANFTDYSAGGFSEEEQRRLSDLCIELDKKGVIFVQSNSDTELIRELYKVNGFKLIPLKTMRMISSKVSSRSKGYDLLITNSPLA
ncbi:DNA adenine methylase [Candidatus Bathyarchaeota archaeon]|nr:DNA adenine methylase [Candidatus Bathyarchaeota archaeon]